MNVKEVMQELEALGTAQNRKIYARHGAGGKMFGVSFGNLQKIAKRIKRNQELAEALWETGNLDAQSLATLIADPKAIDKKTLDAWANSTSFSPVVDYFTKYVSTASPHGKVLASKWMKSKKEYTIRCGYHTMAQISRDPEAYTVDDLKGFVDAIKKKIHRAPNRGKEGMHNALIAIGGNPKLKAYAITAAREIGPVDIDHGETSCKTPDAVAYIEKIHAHASKKKAARAR